MTQHGTPACPAPAGQEEETQDQHDIPLFEPGHVMRRERWERLQQESQQQK